MYESFRAPSNPIGCSENSVSRLLTPNCGLPLHNNPTLLFNEPSLCVKPSLPQTCKSNSLPSTPCVTPSKPSCGTKGDTLIGLTSNNVLVGTCEKAKPPVIPAPPNPLPKFESEHKGSGSKEGHNCGTKPPQCQPVPVTPAPVTPAPVTPAPVTPVEPTPPPVTPVVVTGSGYGTTI